MSAIKQLKTKMKASHEEFKRHKRLLEKKRNEQHPYYPSMFKEGSKKRPSGKGRVVTFDSENRGLLPDLHYNRIADGHVIHLKDKDTGEVFRFFDPYEFRREEDRVWLDAEGEQDGYYLDGIKFLNETDAIIGQNWLGYDSLALSKLSGGGLKVDYEAKPRGGKKRREEYPFRVMDTMVMSQVLNPERRPPRQAFALGAGNVGPHSIEAHGYKMGRPKPKQEQWAYLEDAMLHRCAEDVEIGEDMYDTLMQEWWEQYEAHPMTGLTIEDAYRVEAFLCQEMALQAQRGFRLDFYYAHELVHELDDKIREILENALPHMPLKIKKTKLKLDAIRAATEKAGQEFLLGGKQKIQVGHKPATIEYNKKRLKWWLKIGGKKKNFTKAKYMPVYEKTEITHGSSRMTNWGFVTQTGNYSSNSKKDFPEHAIGNIKDHKDPVVAGPYTPVIWEEITLGNRDIVRQTLYEYGWRGVNLTDGEEKFFKKNEYLPYHYAGKLDEASIDAWQLRAEKSKNIEIPPWAKGILEYYVLTSRRNQILNKKDMIHFKEKGTLPKQQNGKQEIRGLVPRARDTATGKEFQDYIVTFGVNYWEKKQWTEDDEFRVPAEAVAIGTNTFRMRHKYVVNIPTRGLYGKQMRRLFIASKGKVLLGCDGSGLELRMLSHFMNDKEYEDILLNGDIHNHNMEKAGLDSRDVAKTFIYAFLYGSGIMNLALVCGMSEAKMADRVAEFLAELPLLKDLIEGVKEAARENGYLLALDGRRGRVRKDEGKVKEHTALNVLLQMTGSICMKWGLYFAVKAMREAGIETALVCNMHDEIQMEIPEELVKSKSYKIKSSDWKAEEKRVLKTEDGEYWSAPSIIKGNPKEDKKITVERKHNKAGHIICKGFEDAGVYLSIRTPLAGEYKIGKSWEETH